MTTHSNASTNTAAVKAYLQDLQQRIVAALEAADGKTFLSDSWERPEGGGGTSRLLEEAEAYRSRVTANAEGDASRFTQVQEAYAKAPAVTRDRMYLETMQQIFANTTKVMVDANVKKVDHIYHGLLTICVITLQNGFTVTGESACASPENYRKETGEKISYENAYDKIWALMGYELKNKLAMIEAAGAPTGAICQQAAASLRAVVDPLGLDG